MLMWFNSCISLQKCFRLLFMLMHASCTAICVCNYCSLIYTYWKQPLVCSIAIRPCSGVHTGTRGLAFINDPGKYFSGWSIIWALRLHVYFWPNLLCPLKVVYRESKEQKLKNGHFSFRFFIFLRLALFWRTSFEDC